MDANKSSRTNKRRSLSLMVKGRVQSREVFVDLIDISEGGCKLKGTSGFAQIGDRVTMKVGGVAAPLGHVVWMEDRLAGVSFDGEIHSAVLDHLCESQLGGANAGNSTFRRV